MNQSTGSCRHSCFFLALGDLLVLEPYSTNNNADGATWMHRILRSTSSPGTKLGTFVKALVYDPEHPKKRETFAKYAIKGSFHEPRLPASANAGGFRPGAIQALYSVMPGEKVIPASGHDMRSVSAMYEYLHASYATLQPAMTVLAGFPAMAWGTNGKGPVAPSLEGIAGVVDEIRVNSVIKRLFALDSSATPEVLKPNGRLFPMVQAVFATLLMYFKERWDEYELLTVNKSLLDVWAEEFHSGLLMSALHDLDKCGNLIRIKFNNDNLGLTSRDSADCSARVVEAVQQLAGEEGEGGERFKHAHAADAR